MHMSFIPFMTTDQQVTIVLCITPQISEIPNIQSSTSIKTYFNSYKICPSSKPTMTSFVAVSAKPQLKTMPWRTHPCRMGPHSSGRVLDNSVVGGYDSKAHVPGHSTKNAAESFLSRPGSTRDWQSREGFEPRRNSHTSVIAHNRMYSVHVLYRHAHNK